MGLLWRLFAPKPLKKASAHGAAGDPSISLITPKPVKKVRRAVSTVAHPIEAAEFAVVANNLEATIATAEPRQAKALLRLLIKDLRVNARSEILPTYRVVTPTVCALPSSVGAGGIEPPTSRV